MASLPKKRPFSQIPSRRILETTPSVQPSLVDDDEIYYPRAPSLSEFINEPLIDCIHTLWDTDNGFSGLLDVSILYWQHSA
jgi:hypothetical protein